MESMGTIAGVRQNGADGLSMTIMSILRRTRPTKQKGSRDETS